MSKPKGSKQGPRRPIAPWLLCTATSKSRDGEPCRNPAVPGSWTCAHHGGASPQALAAASRRVEQLLPFALQRLAEMLSSADDRVVLVAAKDLLDRAGARVPAQLDLSVSGHVTHEVDAEVLAHTLRELRAAPATLEREIVDALARQHGIQETDPQRRLAAVHTAVVTGHEAEVVTSSSPRPTGNAESSDEVTDAEVVSPHPPAPRALPRPRRTDDDTVTLSNGERWPSSALSPG